MDEFLPGLAAKFRTSMVIAQMNAVLADSGIGAIPYFMANGEKKLMPVLPDLNLERGCWLQVIPDSKEIARVRTAIDFMRHLFIPQQGGPGSRSTMTCMLLSSTASPNCVYMATSAASRP